MSDHSDITSSTSRPPVHQRAPRIEIISSSSPSSSSSDSNRRLNSDFASEILEPFEIMSSLSSSRTYSANAREEVTELDTFIKREATTILVSLSPHDSPQNPPFLVGENVLDGQAGVVPPN